MKKKIILISPSLNNGEQPIENHFPFSAIMIFGTILKNNNYNIEIIDGCLYNTDDCIKKIINLIDDNTICVCFSVMTSLVPWSYTVTKKIKNKFPKLCIIWGGYHPTIFPEQTIKNKYIDIIAINESTNIIVQLMDTLSKNGELSKIPGIYFKSKNKIIKTSEYIHDDLSKIPFFDFSLIDTKQYSHNSFVFTKYLPSKNIIFFPIISGLGCVRKCTFCINVILKKRYRYRTAEEIIDRIEYLQKTYNANSFWFLDEDFFLNKKRLLRFLDLIEERNLHFYWRANLRVDYFCDNYINIKLVKRLEKCGLSIIVMGAECGSQNILDYIKKEIKIEEIIHSAEILSHTNIIAKYSFMVGLPTETKEDIRNTYKLALKIGKILKKCDLSISPFKLYPSSPIYIQSIKKYNIIEPKKVEDWAKIDYSESIGYISYKENPWIQNHDEFNQLIKVCDCFFRFFNKKGKVSKLMKTIVEIRFKFDFFNFLFFGKFILIVETFIISNKNMVMRNFGRKRNSKTNRKS